MGFFSSLFATQKSKENMVGFYVGLKGPTEPVKFGFDLVMSALESTQEDVKDITNDLAKITGSGSSIINQKLLEHDALVRLILTASESAASFLYLIREGIVKDVLEQVVEGMYKGFENISQLFPESMSSEINSFSAMQFQIYLKSLDDEIQESDGNFDGFNSGKTAILVADRIAKECGIDELFQLSNTGVMEKIMFERHVAVAGIIYLLTVCPELKITYRS